MASETPDTCDRGAQLNLELTRGVVRKDAETIGRIVRTASGPAGKPWMWSITTRQDSVGPVLGYEASREAAMEKFAKSWHRA